MPKSIDVFNVGSSVVSIALSPVILFALRNLSPSYAIDKLDVELREVRTALLNAQEAGIRFIQWGQGTPARDGHLSYKNPQRNNLDAEGRACIWHYCVQAPQHCCANTKAPCRDSGELDFGCHNGQLGLRTIEIAIEQSLEENERTPYEGEPHQPSPTSTQITSTPADLPHDRHADNEGTAPSGR